MVNTMNDPSLIVCNFIWLCHPDFCSHFICISYRGYCGIPSPVCSSLFFLQGVVLYSRDNKELDLLLFWEVCDFVSRVDRVLSRPGGSLLLAGRSGVGRHTATCLVSHMHGYTLFTPKISRGYTLKHFSNDLKTVSMDCQFYLFILCRAKPFISE